MIYSLEYNHHRTKGCARVKKAYPCFGTAAPLLYTLAVIAGGFLVEGYSHLYNSISELTASNVPRIPVIFGLFFLYNAFLILFGVGLWSRFATGPDTRMRVVSVILMVLGVLGIALLYYVQDPRTGPVTFKGTMHIILAAACSILSMVAIVLGGLSFRKSPETRKLAAYSFISFAVVFVTGGITAISTANNSPLGGLFERLTIGAFLQWIFVISVVLAKQKEDTEAPARAGEMPCGLR